MVLQSSEVDEVRSQLDWKTNRVVFSIPKLLV